MAQTYWVFLRLKQHCSMPTIVDQLFAPFQIIRKPPFGYASSGQTGTVWRFWPWIEAIAVEVPGLGQGHRESQPIHNNTCKHTLGIEQVLDLCCLCTFPQHSHDTSVHNDIIILIYSLRIAQLLLTCGPTLPKDTNSGGRRGAEGGGEAKGMGEGLRRMNRRRKRKKLLGGKERCGGRERGGGADSLFSP